MHVWAKAKKSGRMYRYFYGEPLAALYKVIGDGIPEKTQDFYITANTMSAGDRTKEQLYSLNNIVIDIDNHGGADPEAIQQQYFTITDYYRSRIMDGSGFFIPNTIIFTGRGVQLWYTIEQISYKRLDIYETITGEILRQAAEMLADNPETLHGLTIDQGASRNAAGLYRAPWSYNRRAKKRAEYIILHDDYINTMAEAKEIRQREKQDNSKIIPYKTALNGAYMQALKRHTSILQLVRIRQEKGQTIERDNILFCISCIWGKVCQDDAEIMEKVKESNRAFNKPMTDTELKKIMCTALKKRYTARNNTIIERLAITEEEQATIKFFGGNGREAERQRKRSEKADRNKQIIRLYESGQTQEAIAATLNISRRTVCNILERNHARKCDEGRLFEREAYTDAQTHAEAIQAQINPSQDATGANLDGARADNSKLCKNRPIYCGNNGGHVEQGTGTHETPYLRLVRTGTGQAAGDPEEHPPDG